MALETLKGIKDINGVKILQERVYRSANHGEVGPLEIDWDMTDEARKHSPIYIDHDVNMISFRIQNGPIKEVGVNGCQVTDIIATAKVILEGLNEKFPSVYNTMTIENLNAALVWQERRTADRRNRGVEGKSEA